MITLTEMSAPCRPKCHPGEDFRVRPNVIINMLIMITLDHLARGRGRPAGRAVWPPGPWPGGLRDARQSGPLAPCHARTRWDTRGHSRAASPPGHRGPLARWQWSRAHGVAVGKVASLPGTRGHASGFFSFISPGAILFREGGVWNEMKRKGKPSSQAGQYPPAHVALWHPGPLARWQCCRANWLAVGEVARLPGAGVSPVAPWPGDCQCGSRPAGD